MQCEDARELVSALIDGEVAGAQKRELSTHIASCPICTGLANDYRSIGKQLRARYERAPAYLTEKIQASLARERIAGRPLRSFDWRQAMRQAAVVLCSVGVSALLTWHLAQSSGEQAHSQRDIIAAHMRSLVQESPTQIASSDRHTVKPWFTGRIDFAPPVKDLAANDFALVGGRLDIVGERRVAAVVYKRRQHIINVFMWPASSSETSDLRTISSKGYNILSWTAGGTTYWAVSDLNAVEMGELQKLL